MVNDPLAVTSIEVVVAPELQLFPIGLLDVSVTVSPSQTVVGPLAVIVGVAGIGLTVTTVGLETAEEQPKATSTTVYVPEVVMVVEGVKSPLLQTLPEVALDVRTTLSPEQNVVGPEALTVGVGGVGFTVMEAGNETAEVQPNSTTKAVKIPAVLTVIACVLAPVLQVFPAG